MQVSAALGSVAHRPSTVPDAAVRLRSEGHHAGSVRRPDSQDVESLLHARPGGSLVTSLRALAGSSTLPALHGARRAVQQLDAVDYEVSVEVRDVAAETLFEIAWTPVTAVVDLMLDWDLLELEITLTELAEWLDVEVVVALRALDRLARYTGVTVAEPAGDNDVVRVWLDLDDCPLTSSVPGALSGSA